MFLLVFLVLLNVYILGVYLLHRAGKLGGGTFTLAGPFLMWKTQRGKDSIERVAKARAFWRVFGNAAIYTTWACGVLVFLLLVFQLGQFVTSPKAVADATPPPQFLIGLPGVNPLIPVWYGLVGLTLALIVHEGAHGVLARAQDLKVKSLGLLLFIVPIGAFVEPDEKDMERATARQKNRVFAAGPMANIVLATVAALLFSQLAMASVGVVNDGEGVGVGSVVDGMPASLAGLAPGDVLLRVGGQDVPTVSAFNTVMNGSAAQETVNVTYLRGGATFTTHVTLADKYDYYERVAPQANRPEYKWKGFMGIGTTPLRPDPAVGVFVSVGGLRDILADPFSQGLRSFMVYISYPFLVFGGVDLFQSPYRDFLVLDGPLGGLPVPAFVIVANFLYWLFWLNLMLGTFNALPAGPLDGGQMFRTTLRDWLIRFYRVDRQKLVVHEEFGQPGVQVKGADEETQVKLNKVQGIVKSATWTLGFFILGLILMPILGPGIVRVLGIT